MAAGLVPSVFSVSLSVTGRPAIAASTDSVVLIIALLLLAASLVLTAVGAKAAHGLAFAGVQPAPSPALHLEAAVATAWSAFAVAIIGNALADAGLCISSRVDSTLEITAPGRTACALATTFIVAQCILATIAVHAVRGFANMRANLCPCCCRAGAVSLTTAAPLAVPTSIVYVVPPGMPLPASSYDSFNPLAQAQFQQQQQQQQQLPAPPQQQQQQQPPDWVKT